MKESGFTKEERHLPDHDDVSALARTPTGIAKSLKSTVRTLLIISIHNVRVAGTRFHGLGASQVQMVTRQNEVST